jgi:aspartyl protease family protein
MLKLALGIIVTASVIGALMPSTPSAVPAPAPPTTISVAPKPAAPLADDGSDMIRLARQADGHFYVESQVNGYPVRFLVDTGASMVALSVKDAESAAVPVNPSMFDVVGRGASGDVRGQKVELAELSIAGKAATRVEAVVIDGGQQSLLGQSFLSRFDVVEIHGDEMLLH